MAARQVKELAYPLMALLVSGGHTELVYVSEPGDYKLSVKRVMTLLVKHMTRLVVSWA